MASSYIHPRYAAVEPPEVVSGEVRRVPVAIVGAGPVGLAAAGEFARLGRETIVLDEDDTVSTGSRAICWAKRSLEVLDRIGVADRMVDKGVIWKLGRLYHRDREVYNFDLLPEDGHKMPAFINLQQYYVEEYLVDAVTALGRTEIRWKNRVTGLDMLDDGGTRLVVETPSGHYAIEADVVLAADGVRSPIRRSLGLDFEGKVFEDRFLIADVRMKADFPSERWFWFEPPFHSGQSVLLHKQPDDVYRIDFQLGWDADPEHEKKPEVVIPRLKQMLGEDVAFDLEWVSVYTFTCRRMGRFRHGPVFFVGDSAHVVSPFGARGGNGGIQDIDDLCWKVDRVLKREAPASLLDSYDDERVPAADENILNSTRSTDFMTPKSRVSEDFREAALEMAEVLPFARKIVNSGRLSTPHTYRSTPLSTPDDGVWSGGLEPGAPAMDAPVHSAGAPWLLNHLGHRFVMLRFVEDASTAPPLVIDGVDGLVVARRGQAPEGTTLIDPDGTVFKRYGAMDGVVYLIRPDQHVAARFGATDVTPIERARDRALGMTQDTRSRRAVGA